MKLAPHLALTLTLLSTPIAFAQTSPQLPIPNSQLPSSTASRPAKDPTPRDIPEALANVGSTSFALREAAVDFLMRQPADTLNQVEKHLEKETDPEAATRLARVAIHLYAKSLTGFEGKSSILGIALNLETVELNHDAQTAIAVMELQPGFPAAELLKTGDRLIAINGNLFPDTYTVEEFRQYINTRKPGIKITFTVVRANNQLKIEIPLAGMKEEGLLSLNDYMNTRRARIEIYIANLKSNLPEGITIPGLPPTPRDPPPINEPILLQ